MNQTSNGSALRGFAPRVAELVFAIGRSADRALLI